MDTKALRQKILDLAIHGKLVPQDPNDEPASVLLERIRAEKERLIKEGKIKKGKKSAKTSDKPHYPFELPKGWVWCRLDDIAYVASGSTPEKSSFVPKGIPYIKMYNLRNQKIDFEYKPQYITAEIHNGKLQRSRTEVGDLIMNIVGPPLGKLAIIPPSLPQANFNQAAVLIRPYLHKDNINVYLKAYLEEMSEINSISTKGSAGQVNISLTQSQNMRIPLPPLPEIERIIKNLKYWLSFVDNIEENKEKLQDSIRQVKSKVLDLAIHGKLVPQDPNDEPAIDLLKRINPKAEITCDTPQYGKLPKGWCSCTLRNVCSFTNGFAFSSDAYKNNGIPLVRISNITNEGKIDLNSCVYIQDEIDEQYIIEKGDFLVAMSGATTGKMGVYTYGEISYLNQRVGKIKASKALYTPYMHYLMYSQVDNILKMAYGGAQPNISAKAILAIRILLPPLAEQQRIVAKIEDLFTQLDKIEASL
mgnify:CR=1 FL=1